MRHIPLYYLQFHYYMCINMFLRISITERIVVIAVGGIFCHTVLKISPAVISIFDIYSNSDILFQITSTVIYFKWLQFWYISNDLQFWYISNDLNSDILFQTTSTLIYFNDLQLWYTSNDFQLWHISNNSNSNIFQMISNFYTLFQMIPSVLHYV